MKLQGKTALVTGGGTGIGEGIALALAAEGCRVAIAGRRVEKLRDVAARSQSGPPMLVHPVDVAERQSVEELFRWAEAELGQIDILVNSAGVNFPRRTMADMSPETWDKIMTINNTGVYDCIRCALPAMRGRRDGLIVNICSTAGKRTSMLAGVAYCASKFAVSALSSTVALEEGKNGIRVTSICPGEVETPILEERPVIPNAEHRARMLQPADIAAAVVMIACLPPRAHVAELIIKPVGQDFD
ncbi:MAG TPA: SDR family NAD(P)-dependent oxidoreductase [Pirellulales bacterium]|jgi:NAD(P)-dependent dehydrogenase (short-subunit alcohol dehydrogenase family)|nr:SDR family NAD(P)-dependent oxidoreductase [Pirellulales bacterium]